MRCVYPKKNELERTHLLLHWHIVWWKKCSPKIYFFFINLLIYIFCSLSVFDFCQCYFRWTVPVWPLCRHKMWNGSNNRFEWYTLRMLFIRMCFCCIELYRYRHTLAVSQSASQTHASRRRRGKENIKATTLKIISVDLGVLFLFIYIILLMSDEPSTNSIDFQMNCIAIFLIFFVSSFSVSFCFYRTFVWATCSAYV